MMLSIHYQRLHSFALVFILGLSVLSKVAGTDIPLTEIGSWNSIDSCAQSCAISVSSAFSSQNACPSSDPASCICNVAPAVSNVAGKAHVCASASCKAFPSSSEDPERARAALTSYCLSNGVKTTVMATARSSPAAASSSTVQVPATTKASSTNAQPLSSPSMVTSTTSTSLGSPTTSLNPTGVQATTSSSTPQSAPGWMYTTTGNAVVGVLMAVVAILIISTLCWIFRKYLRTWGPSLAIKLRLKKPECDAWAAGDQKETDQTALVERSDNRQDGRPVHDAHSNVRRSLHPQLLHVTTKNGQTCDCHAKLDSGADDNFISLTQLKKLGYDQEDLEPCDHVWNAFGDPNLKSLGSLELTWTTQNRTQPREPVAFYVLDATFNELVLGQKFSFKEGLLSYNRTAWVMTRNKKMSKEERDRLKREKEEEAAQSLDRRNIQWLCEATTGLYFFIDADGRKVYQNQGGRPTGSN